MTLDWISHYFLYMYSDNNNIIVILIYTVHYYHQGLIVPDPLNNYVSSGIKFGKGHHDHQTNTTSMASSREDLYSVLKVNKAASSDEIKRSYQNLVKQVPQLY